MSDFLTRLVMHAGKALDVVRPRPLSRFEDSAPPPVAFGQQEITGPVAPPSRIPFVTSLEPTERARTGSDVPAMQVSVSGPEQGTRSVESRADRSPAPTPHRTVQAPQPAAMRAESSRATPLDTLRHETTHSITRVVEHVVRTEPRPQSGVGDSTPARPLTPSPVADRVAPLGPAQHRVPLVKPATVVASGAEERQASTRPPAESPGRDDLTVEITIGRVDVRAVVPPRPAARESRAARPELSLEDYLQRRGRRT